MMMICFICQCSLERDALMYLSHIKGFHPIIFSMMSGILQTQNLSLADIMQAMLVTQLEDELKYKQASETFCKFMESYFQSLKQPSYIR